MSLLKHLVISIAITIFIAWRFPETNLQIAIQNPMSFYQTNLYLIYSCSVQLVSVGFSYLNTQMLFSLCLSIISVY